jgi:pSer/pThr/pTyr-binding forkhead associated (FHA) protein
MTLVTLRVIDGADRGRVFDSVPTPLSIGREEGNTVQLNDERISRFHVKIQEDQDKVVLTDLESTNGSKVNGESTQLCVLRHGDVITVGRTVLLYGSREEIALRLMNLRGADLSPGIGLEVEELDQAIPAIAMLFEVEHADDPQARSKLHTLLPPELPDVLSPGQAAQLAELLQYLHLRIRGLVRGARTSSKGEHVTIEQRQWQNLLDLEDQLAKYLRKIGEPER